MEPLANYGYKHVHRDGNPYLDAYSILGGPVEDFDAKVLFDPLEEQFDLPTRFVEGRNGQSWYTEIVREKHEGFAGQWVAISDTA